MILPSGTGSTVTRGVTGSHSVSERGTGRKLPSEDFRRNGGFRGIRMDLKTEELSLTQFGPWTS